MGGPASSSSQGSTPVEPVPEPLLELELAPAPEVAPPVAVAVAPDVAPGPVVDAAPVVPATELADVVDNADDVVDALAAALVPGPAVPLEGEDPLQAAATAKAPTHIHRIGDPPTRPRLEWFP